MHLHIFPKVCQSSALNRPALMAAAMLGVTAMLHAQVAPPREAVPATQEPPASLAPVTPTGQASETLESGAPVLHPLAIVALDSKIPGGASEVSGAVQVFNGRAFITDSGTITSGNKTVAVTVPYRGTLRICASTTVKMTADSTVPAGEIPGLMMALDHGAAEASFATGRNSDFFLTPDFRILIGGPGAAEVKVRLGPKGDTCVDNAGVAAPYVLVSSVFDGGSYRVQSGQRVMFQHGSLHEVVDHEKEPCGCPAETNGSNDFPLAQSEGLAPLLHPLAPAQGQAGHESQSTEALVYNGGAHSTEPAAEPAAPAPQETQPAPTPVPATQPVPPPAMEQPKKKHGFFKRMGGFFRKIFGAE